jgi:glutamate formiminotransferase/glutamate formiminotransferase/formiminotetrahydrofolate cyclodeaminase
VGAADVVPLVPLGSASMADAVEAAHRLGERIWGELRVPVFFYGEAAGGRRLAEIRAGRVPPDLGDAPHPTAGAVCVGARPPLVAYNLVFTGLEAGEARSAAGRLRALPGVQALAFPVSGGAFQLSMNLTRLGAVGVGAAYEESVRLVGRPGRPELVGLCPAAAAGPGCDGALLEGRLAASAAAQGAAAARARGGEEMTRLAARLDAESHSLRELAGGQEAVLAGAERAAALVRVLRAAQIEDAGLEALLSVAAAGLRAAVTAETAARFATRLALLDRPNAR